MIMLNFKDFVDVLPDFGKVLAIDWGIKRIGVAISDQSQRFAFPLATVSANNLETDEKIVGIIIGLPTYMDGSESDTTKMVREFAEKAATGIWKDLPITFLDETLSSAEAEDMYKSAGKSDKEKGLDAFAAAIILEDALGKIQRLRND